MGICIADKSTKDGTQNENHLLDGYTSNATKTTTTPCSALFGTITILVWCALILTGCVHYIHNEYILKLHEHLKFDDDEKFYSWSYYERHCDPSDISTSNLSDLIVDGSRHSTEDAVDMILTHGGVIIPQILSSNTSQELRTYLDERNHAPSTQDKFYVHEAFDTRWSLKLTTRDHPSIPEALQEIGEHPVLRPLVEQLCGPHPAVTELTSISAAYGAEPQRWHADVASSGSPAALGGAMRTTFALFIPLQHTVKEMGATGLCPGTHMCPFPTESVTSMCDTVDLQAEVDPGTAFLMDQASWHRGGAHVAEHLPDRVMFIVTFTSSPRKRKEEESLTFAMGLSHSMRWDMWGHTIEDMATAKEHPWNMWNALGLFKKGNYWGWTLPMVNLIITATGGINSTEQKDYREIFMTYLETVEKILPLAYGLALLGCLMIVTKESLHSQKRLLFKGHLIVALIAAITMTWFCNTQWAKSVQSDKLFRKPTYPIIPDDIPPSYYHALKIPDKNDILFGDRMNKRILYAKRRFLDYHPGNKAYRSLVGAARPIYVNLPMQMKAPFILSMIDELINEQRTFLRQNDYGDWERMDKAQVFNVMRHAFLRGSHPFLQYVSENIDFIINEAKYGYWQGISRRFVPSLMDRLKRMILDEGEELEKLPGRHLYLKLNDWKPLGDGVGFMKSFSSTGMTPLRYWRKT